MNLVTNTMIKNQFRGCLVGALVGDALGAHFESDNDVKLKDVLSFFKKKWSKQHSYTDDTAMARSVADSLIDNNGFNELDIAKRFTNEYFSQQNRGYGAHVGKVFTSLFANNFSDIKGPASSQFDGSGSYGNGAAMRIAPAGLFLSYKDYNTFKETVDGISLITHSHPEAVLGARLIAKSVSSTLKYSSQFDAHKLLDSLNKVIDRWKYENQQKNESSSESYSKKLKKISEFLIEGNISKEQVIDNLGNGIAAIDSVPTAIFSFLYCQSNVKEISTENPFERTIIYSISLGGDTDTIATMAGALAGVHYGIGSVPQSWVDSCEAVQTAVNQADALFNLVNCQQASN